MSRSVQSSQCEQPECHAGYIRVPVIVTEIRYGAEYRYARIEEIECYECHIR